MNRYTIIALALLASPAFATCPPGDNRPYPECLKPPVVTPPTTPPSNHNEQGQEQGQQQGQAQGQAQGQGQIATGGTGTGIGVGIGQGGSGGAGGQGGAGGNAGAFSSSAGGAGGRGGSSDQSQNAFSGANNVTDVSTGASAFSDQTSSQAVTNTNGGNTTSSSADGSGNADVSIGGDRYEGSQTVFQAAMPSAPPVFGPGSVAQVSYGQCGPYMGVSSEDVQGTYIGLFRKQQIYLGRSDRIVEYNGESFRQKRFPDGRWYLEGQRAVRTTTVLNVSGSRQVSLGGGDTGGGYGQAGVGGGSSMQRLVTQIDREPCVAYIEQATQVPVIEFKEPRVPRG